MLANFIAHAIATFADVPEITVDGLGVDTVPKPPMAIACALEPDGGVDQVEIVTVPTLNTLETKG